ncbi:hypothetical protein FRC07_010455, partial [Ceratobasidium sp. 392]
KISKALKVPELKDILTKSNTPIGSKANKADLIAKILATPVALELAGGGTGGEVAKGGDDDLLAPPDEFDWEGGAESKGAAPAAEPAAAASAAEADPATAPESTTNLEAPATEPTTTTTTEAPTSEAPQSQEDIELERRKARAARFGVPLVEQPAKKTPKPPRSKGKSDTPVAQGSKKAAGDAGKTAGGSGSGNKKAEGKKADEPKSVKISAKEAAPNDDDAKLAARAARFGISAPAAGGGAADEEEEKKKKRAAKFADPSAKKAKTET